MITFFEKEQAFLLQMKSSTYCLRITENAGVMGAYWGDRIDDVRGLPDEKAYSDCFHRMPCGISFGEYEGEGNNKNVLPAIQATFADGTRNVCLAYDGYRIEGERLEIALADKEKKLRVQLVYEVHAEEDMINRYAVITNEAEERVMLGKAYSACWHLPMRSHYRLTHLSGDWNMEFGINRQEILPGRYLLETRNGLSGPKAVPLFMIDRDGRANEESGEVYFGTLHFSGNFRMIIDKDPYGWVSIMGGVQEDDFSWPLQPGESFTTPIFSGGYTKEGFGGASRCLHDELRNHVMHEAERNRLMPTILNSYGMYGGFIDEEKILGLIHKAANLGIELLVIDAGWYGIGKDHACGMGDWTINRERFPNGLTRIREEAEKYNMKFGLWMEPEAVSPRSRIYREHPEWLLGYPARKSASDERAMLNLGLPEVRDYLIQVINRLIEEYGASYFKMDMNRRVIQEFYSVGQPAEQQQTWAVRYAQNLCEIYRSVKRKHPEVLIENCASGGRRVDFAMAEFSGRINRSDNQDAVDELKLHEGFSMFMLPKFAGGGTHIGKPSPDYYTGRSVPIRYRAIAAMMGSPAVSAIADCTEEELQEIASYMALYKEIRPVVNLGDIHRLASVYDKPYAAFEYALRDGSQAVLFMLGKMMDYTRVVYEPICLRGLNADAMYEVEGMGIFSGAVLMHQGLFIPMHGEYDAKILRIHQVKGCE